MQNVPLSFSKGLDRSIAALRADKGTFYDLLNFKQDPSVFGRLVQTPYFYQSSQATQGTYWDGAAPATEPTTSSVRMITQDFIMTDYVIESTGGTQRQVFYQTTVPAGVSIYTGCFLVINSTSSLAITLGSTLDVEMTGAAAFRWRKNGGGWTAGVPSTAGVNIDSGNATLYFLANTGFAGTETWAWTRTDRSLDDSSSRNVRPAQQTLYKGNIYFTNCNDRIMVAYDTYAISAGYRPIYGTYLTFFDDHMIIGGYSTTPISVSNATRARTVGWSDKGDVNNFIATDTNEADTYTLPQLNNFDTLGSSAILCPIVGVFILNATLYVATRTEIYYTAALGMPLVFSFQKLVDSLFAVDYTTSYQTTTVQANGGVYFLTEDDILFFDGATFKQVGRAIVPVANQGSFALYPDLSMMYYDRFAQELVIFNYAAKLLFVYQEVYGTWYTRSASFLKDPTCMFADGLLFLGTASRKVLCSDDTWTSQPVYDAAVGTAYATPKITSQLFGEQLRYVKEFSSVYVGAVVYDVSTTYYSTGANLQVKLYWYIVDDGILYGTALTESSATWVETNADGMISFPRVAYRAAAVEVQLAGLVTGKPPGQLYVSAIEPQIPDLTPPTR